MPEINLGAGRLAQLVERLLYTQNVGGSSPSPPTTKKISICFTYSFSAAPRTFWTGSGTDVPLSFISLPIASRASRSRSAA